MPESPIEALFRETVARDWWPELPLVQECPVTIRGQRYRLDFAVPDWHFGVELDGYATHSSTTAIAKDRRRQRALERDGWTICRFGGQEITQSAANCVWEAKAALCGLVIERASAADRAWFEEHPHAAEYFRPLIPGEFPQIFAPGTKVHVRPASWGRVRETHALPIGGEQPSGAELQMVRATPGLLDALAEDFRTELEKRGTR